MDPYVYPGTEVLENLRDVHDPALWREFETDATSRRIRQLKAKPLSGRFDAAHVQAIHRHIFQDVYRWAGEFRTVGIGFAPPQFVRSSLDRMSEQLKNEKSLQGLNLREFATRAAYYLGELNAIHPFREGNGRTQSEFIRHLALHSDFALSWENVSKDELYEAARLSFHRGQNSGFEEILRRALT